MKSRLLLILLAMTLIVSMIAFGACTATEEEAPPEEEGVWQWPDRLLVTCMSTRSPTYGSFVAWTTPLMEDTGMDVRVICESDSRLQQMWVKEGRFFSVAPHQNRAMMYGNKGFARRDWGAWQSRIWMPAGQSDYTFATLGDSGIKTVYDIKPGMKMIYITLSEEPQQMMYGLLAWAKVNYEDVIWVPCGATAQLGRFIQDGKGDVAVAYTTSAYWFEVEASPHGVTWLPLDAEADPEGAQRLLEWYPWTGFGISGEGGPPSSWGVPMLTSLPPYITSVDTDPELVYNIVKWVDENYDSFKDGHPWCTAMTLDLLLKEAETHYEPIHDGAVRYLEEKGLWTTELEARRQFNIEQLTKWVDAYQDAIGMADDRDIDVNQDNEEWQELWENYRASKNLPLLVFYQGPEKEQAAYSDYYETWERVKPQ